MAAKKKRTITVPAGSTITITRAGGAKKSAKKRRSKKTGLAKLTHAQRVKFGRKGGLAAAKKRKARSASAKRAAKTRKSRGR